jgi:hypothetical protein
MQLSVSRTFRFVLVVGVIVAGSLVASSILVRAQGGVSINFTGYSAGCSSFHVQYDVFDSGYYGSYQAQLTVYNSAGAIGSAHANVGMGPHAADVAITLQPQGTYLHIVIQLFNGGTLVASAQGTPEPCYGGSSRSNGSSSGATWSGYTDGRLNPNPTEYYSIYCENSSIKVYGKSGQVERIPLEIVKNLDPNGGTMLWNTGFLIPYQVVRSGDTITISGNFGWTMPQAGSKSFSLSQCIQHDDASSPDPGFTALHISTVCYSEQYVRNQIRAGRRPPPPDQICRNGKNSSGVITR